MDAERDVVEGRRPLPPRSWRRGEEPEFSRLGVFTDAVYAIALTLLVLDLRIDPLKDAGDPGEMLDALGDLKGRLIAFAVAFFLLARYWISAHDFVGHLRAFTRPLVGLNLLYLAFVAFLPFPTGLIGEYESNPVAMIFFALVLAVISSLEAAMFVVAHRSDLFRRPLPKDLYRWALLGHFVPVVVLVVTMPLAFLDTPLPQLSWAVLLPVTGMLVNRRAPEGQATTEVPGEGGRRIRGAGRGPVGSGGADRGEDARG